MARTSTILIIDDDPALRCILRARLAKGEGYQVEVAENGLDGLDAARSANPDVVLLDWKLPDINGLSVLRQLKGAARSKGIPVIMLTGRSLMADVETAFEAGAAGYVSKPVDFEALARRLAEALDAA